jgi:Alginate export
MKSDLEEYREPGPEPVQRDELNLHQAYLDLSQDLDNSGDRFTLRTGWQELAYGIGRILDPREGPNTRQSFDGLKAITTIDKWEVDGFAVRPDETNGDAFDNPDPSPLLWGIYATHPNWWLENSAFDFYYIGTSRKEAPFFAGVQNEVRHTVGLRLDGHDGSFDYDTEGAYQFGTFGSGSISAWFYSSELGYRFVEDFGQPHLALKFDVHSGNNSSTGQNLNTFESLYARGNYYSEPSPIGAENSIALHPQLDWFPVEKLQLTFSPIFYWRESVNDGVYNFPGYPDRPGSSSQGRFVGTETFIEASWQATRHLNITAAYDHFFRGDFLNDVSGTSDSDYFAVWATVKF